MRCGRLPGLACRDVAAPAMEHFAFRVGPGGHPALEIKLVRRALAFGIDRVEIARAILAEAPDPTRRPLDSTVFLASEPLLPAELERLPLRPRPGAALARAGGLSPRF